MKRKLFFLVLMGIGLFLLNENTNNKVKAANQPCSDCSLNYINGVQSADQAYSQCVVNNPLVYCAAIRTAAIQTLQAARLNCFATCWDDGPVRTGGDRGSRERTPEELACLEARESCYDGYYRSQSVIECAIAGNNVSDCCDAEYLICLDNAN